MNRTKKMIFQAAVKAFSNSGYEGATMDEIAVNGGLSKGTLYYHFSSKYEIFEYIINQGIGIFIEKIEEAMSREEEANEKIRVFCRVQLNLVCEYRDFFKVIMSEIWGLESRHLHIREIIKKYINNIEVYLKEAMDGGIIAKGETSCVVYNFLASIWTAVTYEVINKNMTNIDEVIDNIIKNILCVTHYSPGKNGDI
jgi:TetR/AcrR family transcriptional regulator